MPLQEVFSLLGILLVLVLVLAGSYLFTRWAGKVWAAVWARSPETDGCAYWSGWRWAGTRACW